MPKGFPEKFIVLGIQIYFKHQQSFEYGIGKTVPSCRQHGWSVLYLAIS
jgi:hypothetical protein